jgi:hypothetical protein
MIIEKSLPHKHQPWFEESFLFPSNLISDKIRYLHGGKEANAVFQKFLYSDSLPFWEQYNIIATGGRLSCRARPRKCRVILNNFS